MTIIDPKRLVFIRMYDNCMFCDNPTGPSYIYEIHLSYKLGYITCKMCENICQQTVNQWNTSVYGKVNYLTNKKIKIKRSVKDGIRNIEDGWMLDYPFLSTHNNIEMVHCMNSEKHIEKWCSIDEIIELNPISVDKV